MVTNTFPNAIECRVSYFPPFCEHNSCCAQSRVGTELRQLCSVFTVYISELLRQSVVMLTEFVWHVQF